MLSPTMMLLLVIAWVVSLGGAGYAGISYEEGQYAKAEVKEQRMLAVIKAENSEFADGVGSRLETAIGKIRIINRTTNNEIRQEREIHHVLNDANCAIPNSTLGVLNTSRGYSKSGPSTNKSETTVPTTGSIGR